MALTTMPPPPLGQAAPDFALTGTDGRTHTLGDVSGPSGTVIMVICNHCPYVVGVIERVVADIETLQAEGFGAAAIMPNDTDAYPADSFENMGLFARRHGFTFPYLIDPTQAVARALGAVCTPEFYGLDAGGAIRYAGRLDAGGRDPGYQGPRELVAAMRRIAQTGDGPAEQHPSMGCSIKWRA